MASFMMYLLLSEELEEMGRRRRLLHQESQLNGRMLRNIDLMDMPECKFLEMFRISKSLARSILSKVKVTNQFGKGRLGAISPERKVLTTLHVLATGSYQINAGLNYTLGMSQVSVSRSLRKVIPLIVDAFQNDLRFPSSDEERAEVAKGFQRFGPFENVLGCIGCSHIRILKPSQDEEDDYQSSKGYYSLNVQMICDSNLKILSLTSNCPGIYPNQIIWDTCEVNTEMQRLYESGSGYYLLGDAGYELEPFLITPVSNAPPGSPEDLYTQAHSFVLSTIEKTFAVFKARWKILQSKVNYEPQIAVEIVKCCTILHNLCLRYKIAEPSEEDIMEAHSNEDILIPSLTKNDAAYERRRSIISRYFQ